MAPQIRSLCLSVIKAASFVLGIVSSSTLQSAVYPLPTDGSNVIGYQKEVISRKGETLLDVARRYNMGADEMIEVNPSIPEEHRLNAGVKIKVPSSFVLPDAPHEGILINLAELRLYYFPKDSQTVMTIPVGIGKENGWQTPVGKTEVIRKDRDPVWRPTANVQMEAAKNGTPIPSAFPPGPENPLGSYVLRLGWATYLIHGTNRPEGVGSRTSAGCLRLYPEDVETLYEQVAIGTKVTVINEPYKVGQRQGKIYLEAHLPLAEQQEKYKPHQRSVVQLVQDKASQGNWQINWVKVNQQINQPAGVPLVISR